MGKLAEWKKSEWKKSSLKPRGDLVVPLRTGVPKFSYSYRMDTQPSSPILSDGRDGRTDGRTPDAYKNGPITCVNRTDGARRGRGGGGAVGGVGTGTGGKQLEDC